MNYLQRKMADINNAQALNAKAKAAKASKVRAFYMPKPKRLPFEWHQANGLVHAASGGWN